MTIYPNNYDTDLQLPRIDDNITELGSEAINALRDAVFAIQYTLGLNPEGLVGDLVSRLAVSIDTDGHIKNSELAAHGLITLPVTAAMINDGTIPETKLVLDHSTASLFAAINAISSLYTTLSTNFTLLNLNFIGHIYGTAFSDGYLNRHVASHIDINDGTNNGGILKYTGIDLRDLLYNNVGLFDDTGNIRNAKTVMDALIQINSDLVLHMLSLDGYHNASFINLDTALYTFIPATSNTVQKAFDFLDNAQTIVLDEHRAELHSTGIPRHHNVVSLKNDGYNVYFGPFACQTLNINNFHIVVFTAPGDNSLDWAFGQINSGDYIRINYGGFEARYPIEMVFYTPSAMYQIAIDGYNIISTTSAYAILEKANFDDNHYGILAVAASDHNYYFNPLGAPYVGYPWAGWDTSLGYVPGSAIVITPNCPMVTGIDLCLDDLDSTHYNLYIGFYPDANPAGTALIPTTLIKEIDVTGNQGTTPGAYTLHGIVNNVNRQFRQGGYNYRMIAFEYKGQFGLAITDTIDNPGFSIIYGTSDVLQAPFINNVVELPSGTGKDPLGLGSNKAAAASPLYSTTNVTPTKVFVGRTSKKYNINGQFIDFLSPGVGTNNRYYYDAFFIDTDNFGGAIRQRGIFRVNQNLSTADLYPGCTITLHPYNVADYATLENYYGRFVVENVVSYCDGYSEIWTVDCCSWNGNALSSLPVPTRANTASWVPMKMYFSNDSISFAKTGNDKDYYEIFVSKNGTTFSHLRAVLPLSAVSLNTLIGIDWSYLLPPASTADVINYGWHIVDVSPKLKGFIPVGGVSNTRQVRFVVQNYIAAEGSYEGYICQPNGVGVTTNVGPTIRVKKGEIGRYYDNTGIDYIDILFEDDPANPLSPGIPLASYVYIDIRILETIRTNEQYLCLSSCELLSWAGSPAGNVQLSLWNCNDLRQFGTVSERVLTTSAISFIESGDRWLHQNGCVNGIDYVSAGVGYVEFSGGTVHIDGSIVNVNNFKVFPINMWDGTGTFTQPYILCLKKDGTHELLPQSKTGISALTSFTFFSGATATLRTYTVNQIIEERKDLLPIYILNENVGPGGITPIGTPADIRKFIANNETKDYLVLYNTINISGTTLPIGNFKTWDAVSNYIKQIKTIQNTILVKGTTSIDTAIDFNSIPVSIIGDPGNLVECNVSTGLNITLSNDMLVKGINFKRMFGDNVAIAAAAYSSGFGTIGSIVANATTGTLKNITIDSCTFTTVTGKRKSGYAHILFEKTGDNYTFHNINIINNSFLEPSCQLDIAFVNRLGADVSAGSFAITDGALLSNVVIEGNIGNSGSWMILGSDNYYGGIGKKSRGLSAYGLKIINNSIDYIWHNLSRCVFDTLSAFTIPATSTFTKSLTTLPALYHEVIVQNNKFIGFINKAIDGVLLGVDITVLGYQYRLCKVAGPSMLISSNRGTTIGASINGDVFGTALVAKSPGAIDINHNILTPSIYDPILFNPDGTSFGELPTNPAVNLVGYAIYVFGNAGLVNTKNNLVNISHNTITNDYLDYFPTNGLYNYINPITVTVPASINNNIIEKCISTTGNGIWLIYSLTPLAGSATSSITSYVNSNIISRGSTTINSYILTWGTTQLNRIIILDNVFDSETVDAAGTDYFVINYNTSYAYKFTQQRNINQTFTSDGFQFLRTNNYLTDGLYGWIVAPRADTTTSPPEIYENPGVALDIGNLGSANLADFFYIVIPTLDGAFPKYIDFASLLNVAASPDGKYRLTAYTQINAAYGVLGTNRNINVFADATHFNVSEYTITNDNPAVGGTSLHRLSLDSGLTDLVSRYYGFSSDNRSFTLVLAFCNTDYTFLSLAPGDLGRTWNFNVRFRY